MYEAPSITEIGSIAEMTKAFGTQNTNDAIFQGDVQIGTGNLSKPGFVVPGGP